MNTVTRIEEGTFKDGLLDGFGRIQDEDGFTEIGFFKAGKPWGKL